MLGRIAPAFLLLSGCCVFGREGRLPETWVVPEVWIRMTWAPTDEELNTVKGLLREMNVRIYDATDGQIRIGQFTVYGQGGVWEKAGGVGNIVRGPTNGNPYGYAINGQNPRIKGYFYVVFPEGDLSVAKQGATAAHEWFHAWIGLWDEYKDADGNRSSCPSNPVSHLTSGACIMFREHLWTELCRAENHNPKTLQGAHRGMSCYEWVRDAMKAAELSDITIPAEHINGPTDPPDPRILVVLP